MTPVRFGIIGTGGIANQFVRAVALTENAVITAAASKTPERAAEFAKRNNIPAACASYDELLARDDVDAVYIATTHNFHFDNITQCLCAGKHVLCEKPMVLTEEDAKACFALAKEKNLFLMEAMWTRCIPALQQAKQWIADGRIGKPAVVNAVIGFNAPKDPNYRLYNPALAGGALYDVGVYPIEIVSALLGEPVQDVASRCRMADTGVDECVSLILSYPSADACIQCMFTANPKEYTIVSGSEGVIEIPASHSVRKVFLYDRSHNLVDTIESTYENGFIYEIEETVRCIREGRLTSDINPPEMTIECARIFDAVLGTGK